MQETQEMWVWSLGWEDPLEKEMTTHSSILAWKIPWTEEPDGLPSIYLKVQCDWACMQATLPSVIFTQAEGKKYLTFFK